MTTEIRALELLGQGLSQAVVAGALGVTEGRITQLLSDEEFARKVSEKRIATLQQSTEIDQKYNKLELDVLNKLEKQLPAIYQPMQLLKAAQILNSAKRRGASAADMSNTSNSSPVVNLTLPNAVINQFTKNIHNQIIEVKDGQGQSKSLVTATSTTVARLAAQRSEDKVINSPELNQESSGQNEKSYQPAIAQEGSISSGQLIKQITERISQRTITADDL